MKNWCFPVLCQRSHLSSASLLQVRLNIGGLLLTAEFPAARVDNFLNAIGGLELGSFVPRWYIREVRTPTATTIAVNTCRTVNNSVEFTKSYQIAIAKVSSYILALHWWGDLCLDYDFKPLCSEGKWLISNMIGHKTTKQDRLHCPTDRTSHYLSLPRELELSGPPESGVTRLTSVTNPKATLAIGQQHRKWVGAAR